MVLYQHVHRWVRSQSVMLTTDPPRFLEECVCGEVRYVSGEFVKNAGPGPGVEDTIVVTQDVGFYEPVYKKQTLYLMSDGTVRWKKEQPTEGENL